MAKQSTIEAPPFKTPAPIEDDGITILANASRSGGGAIDVLRKHLVSHSDASIADLKSMLMAASLSLADGTLRTTRTQTLAVLKFVKAKQPSVGIVTVRNSERGLTTPMRANLRAIQWRMPSLSRYSASASSGSAQAAAKAKSCGSVGRHRKLTP
jgi:hypothetical protein